MVEQMREITDAAAATTRRARRNVQRRAAAPAARTAAPSGVVPPLEPAGSVAVAEPFAVVEEWAFRLPPVC